MRNGDVDAAGDHFRRGGGETVCRWPGVEGEGARCVGRGPGFRMSGPGPRLLLLLLQFAMMMMIVCCEEVCEKTPTDARILDFLPPSCRVPGGAQAGPTEIIWVPGGFRRTTPPSKEE